MSLHRALATPPEVLLIPAELAEAAALSPLPAADDDTMYPGTPAYGTLATVALRVDATDGEHWLADRLTSPHRGHAAPARAGIVTFGGPRRDQAAVLRVLHADPVSRSRAAQAVAHSGAGDSLDALVIALAAGAPRDVEPMLAMLDVFSSAAREAGIGSVIVHVPGYDTAGYPTRLVARTANALLISPLPPALSAEPAPFFTARTVRRLVGLRAAEIGAGRLILMLPLHGYIWQRRSPPQAISFRTAMEMVDEWRVPLARDPESRMLSAHTPDGGVIWVPDAPMVAHVVREARAMGVGRFAFVIGAGEDPAAIRSVTDSDQTTSRSR